MSNLLTANKKRGRGQTYIDLLIAIGVLSILGLTLFRLSALSYELISFNRARIAARHLAQEKVEFIRNLPYDNVGTVGGIPPGTLAQLENIKINGLNYVVFTSIVYIDDPFDGTAPDDLLPTDYKRIRIDVSWEGLAASKINPITMITDISPKGIETSAGGGTLSVLVFDSAVQPVGQASVHIVASSVSPPVDLTLKTADNGRVVLPGTPTCVGCYQITVTKTNYSTDKTYSTSEVANPDKPPASILIGQLTEAAFAIDKVSILNITSRGDKNSNFAILPNVSFKLRGEKTIGTDVSDNVVFKYDKTFSTDEAGFKAVSDLEWDNYSILLPTGSVYDVAATNPLTPLSILANTTVNFNFAVTAQSANSLWVVFKDGTTSTPIASVSAKLSDGSGFEESLESGQPSEVNWGQAYWTLLSPQYYTLEATASGYLNFSGNIIVSGNTKETILISPQ